MISGAQLTLLLWVAAIVLFILLFNRLVTLARRAEEAFADIDVQLKHRHDLIPNIVQTVKGFVAHEKSCIEAVAAARRSAIEARSLDLQARAEADLTARLGQFIAVAESHPVVMASPHFEALRREIGEVEHKIAAARRHYNMNVREYNAALASFPGNLLGRWQGLRPRRFYDLGADRVFVDDAPPIVF